jgi:hypothetical protein
MVININIFTFQIFTMSYRVNNAEIEGQHPLIKVTPVKF